MATHSSILAWRIPWIEEPGKLRSVGVTKRQTGPSDLTLSLFTLAAEKAEKRVVTRMKRECYLGNFPHSYTWLHKGRNDLWCPILSQRKESEVKVTQSSLPLWDPMQSMDSPGQNTAVGSLSLLHGIFPTRGSNPGLPHCRWLLYQLSHKGSRGKIIPFKTQIFKGLKENNTDWALGDIPGTVLVTVDYLNNPVAQALLWFPLYRWGYWDKGREMTCPRHSAEDFLGTESEAGSLQGMSLPPGALVAVSRPMNWFRNSSSTSNSAMATLEISPEINIRHLLFHCWNFWSGQCFNKTWLWK